MAKLNKLQGQQLEMDKKFVKSIHVLKNKLATINNEHYELKKMS
jgi:hypothetical protein